MKVPMGPPPSRNPNPFNIATSPPSDTQFDAQFDAQLADSSIITETLQNPSPTSPPQDSKNSSVPYTIPEWSHPPCHPYSLEVLKDGAIIDQLDVSSKGAYMFGRVDLCDFVLEHPTISRFHAVVQFKGTGAAFIYDLGSTHGTLVNKTQVKKKVYTELHVGDVIRFGQSSRLYAFQGPSELMPPEKDLKMLRNAKMRGEMQDREASLLRAKEEASLADGISWGMTDDPIEEATEDDGEEVTWQTYKGALTEKQEKTRAKVLKRAEKVANMKKEIAVIRAKDIPQGGLTQGQQTQIARNEQRISQIMEELENLEETLNESIQESLGARSKKGVHAKTKGTADDEDEAPSDDDEFYDRAKKKPAIPIVGGQQIETADTLLVKKEAVTKEIEAKTNLLSQEKARIKPESDDRTEGGDALDAYMTGLSTQIVLDTTAKLQKELSTLQSELDRILYLLHIADPTGEAARQRDSKAQTSTSQPGKFVPGTVKKTPVEHKKSSVPPVKSLDGSSIKDESDSLKKELPPNEKVVTEKEVKKPSTYTVTKPVWLGATEDREMKENQPKEAALNVNDSDGFVDYKDRKKVLATGESTIEEAGPGLIIRKRKQPEEPGNDKAPEVSTSTAAESTVADAVALLLKHKRGYSGLEGEEGDEIGENQSENNPLTKEKLKPKRVLGPERPAFLERNPDYETWVPPQGQSGDGRTSLNDRYGY